MQQPSTQRQERPSQAKLEIGEASPCHDSDKENWNAQRQKNIAPARGNSSIPQTARTRHSVSTGQQLKAVPSMRAARSVTRPTPRKSALDHSRDDAMVAGAMAPQSFFTPSQQRM